MFFGEDFEVLTASSGAEALAIFNRQSDLAVVISDQRMPGMSGVALLGQIYALNPDPVRIILTAYADFHDISQAINQGHIFQYLQKPWQVEDLKLILQQAVAQYRLRQENKALIRQLDEKNRLLLTANRQLEADLTLQQRLQQERREVEVKMLSQAKLASLGEIATGIAHEINQPLTYISMILQSTVRDIARDRVNLKELNEELQESSRQVQRISKIIHHLRTFGRADSGEMVEVSLPVVLDNTLILYRQKLHINSIGLTITADPDLPAVCGNPTQLEQVLINLLQNSFDALAGVEAPAITVEFAARDGRVVTTFADNGCGLDESVAAKMFEPFFTTKPIGKGTGLGLSIVYGIVSDHGGTIECLSQPGAGCRFVLTLPAMPGCCSEAG